MNTHNNRSSKLTLVIDGNWLLMSRLSILLGKYNTGDTNTFDTTSCMNECVDLMLKSIGIVSRTFTTIDNMIFVSDGGSWRKHIIETEVPACIRDADVEYKGNRTKTEGVDWDGIFDRFTDFTHTLERSGMTVCHEGGIEGDDWCWYLSRRLNTAGTNVLIWSSDADLTQLVSRDTETGIFTCIWEKKAGLRLPERPTGVDASFFVNPYVGANDTILETLVMSCGDNNVHTIVPLDVIINKIVRGDAGDNVMPIVYRTTASGKRYRVGIKDLPDASTIDIFDVNSIRRWVVSLLESKAYKNKVSKGIEDIVDHFVYNRRLVYLHESSYPEHIKWIFEKCDVELSINESYTDISEVVNEHRASSNNILDVLNSI